MSIIESDLYYSTKELTKVCRQFIWHFRELDFSDTDSLEGYMDRIHDHCDITDNDADVLKQSIPSDYHYEDLVEVSKALLAWIDAVPPEIVLPDMPETDRDWVDAVMEDTK